MPDFAGKRPPDVAGELLRVLTARRQMVALAESCTAGLAADLIARFPGASKALWGSFVTYTVDAKTRMLGVPKELIAEHGAVSRPVALAMAEGALERSGVSWAVSITGLAGPGGEVAPGWEVIPAGTVWIGFAGLRARPAEAKSFLFKGSRNEVRLAAAAAALNELLRKILTAEEILV